MKGIFIYGIIWAGMLLHPVAALPQAAHPAHKGQVRIVADSLSLQGDSLHVELDIELSGQVVPSNNSLILTPVVRLGSQTRELPEVIVNGAMRDRMYRRSAAMSSAQYRFIAPPYAVVRTGKGVQTSIPYRITVRYEPWMETASLKLKEEIFGCAGDNLLVTVETLARFQFVKEEPVPAPPPPPAEATPAPAEVPEPPKILQKEGVAYLDFPVGQWRVLRNYRHNAAELDRIDATFDSITRDEHGVIRAICITGYASIEGTYALNEKLSENRAEAFRDYLSERFGYKPGLYRLDWKGEDWEGLVRLIENSQMPGKGQALRIIDEVDVFQRREAKLMQLDGGVPYRYMKEHFFPKLRRVGYKILYTLTERATEKADAK